jgi:hypothetical protein
MAEQRPAAPAAGRGREAAPQTRPSVIYWRYLIFWLLFFGLIYFVSLYGIVAEA